MESINLEEQKTNPNAFERFDQVEVKKCCNSPNKFNIPKFIGLLLLSTGFITLTVFGFLYMKACPPASVSCRINSSGIKECVNDFDSCALGWTSAFIVGMFGSPSCVVFTLYYARHLCD